MSRAFMLLVTLTIVSSGCGRSEDLILAEQSVLIFHERLDAGESNQIYEHSSDELKKVSTQSNFVALLDAVHRKLGNVKSAERQAWSTNYRTSGTFITLTYKTAYTEGEAAEQFLFRMQDHAAALAGYRVNANALVVK